jgi:hypothetical protein
MSASCEYCVLSGSSLYVMLVTCPGDSERDGMSESDREASIMRRFWPTRSCLSIKKSSGHYTELTMDMRVCDIFRNQRKSASKIVRETRVYKLQLNTATQKNALFK